MPNFQLAPKQLLSKDLRMVFLTSEVMFQLLLKATKSRKILKLVAK